MSPRNIKAPFNHLVRKFPASEQSPQIFRILSPKLCRNCAQANFSTNKLNDKARISRNVDNLLYILHEFHGNKS